MELRAAGGDGGGSTGLASTQPRRVRFLRQAPLGRKAVFSDGKGLCLFYKRLDRGSFSLPVGLDADATSVRLTEGKFDVLLSGLELMARARKAKTGVH